MKPGFMRLLRPGDILVIVAAIALLGGTWAGFAGSGGSRAVAITHAGGPDFEVPSWNAQTFGIEGPLGRTEIEVRAGKARIVASPCDGQLCVRAGWLEHTGETAACVPNRVAISLVAADSRFDAVNF